MKYLLDHLNMLGAAVAGKQILLLLDFDGTLSPIAPTPDDAVLAGEMRRELERCAESSSCDVSVISGRALSDVKGKIGIPGITYVGNHGLEIERPNEEPQRIALPQFQSVVRRMKVELAARLASFDGAIIEDKGHSLAVHYRTASAEHRPLIKAVVHETVEAFGGERHVDVAVGSMVLELRPPIGCNKGTIVAELLESNRLKYGDRGFFAIYLGDDATDEDAFKAIRGRGWGVLVGAPRISHAEYYLKNQNEVRALLQTLAGRREEEA